MKNKVVILQRVCAPYRLKFFVEFQKIITNSTLIIGEDIPNSKVKNRTDLKGLNYIKLPTRHINFFGRILTFHKGLLSQFKKDKPEIIICEAESHIIGYLTAIAYKFFFNRNVKLVYWCFIALPGRVYNKYSLTEVFKRNIRKLFDHFFLYHSYGKNALLEMGINEKLITIITNVGNTQRFNDLSKKRIPNSLAKKKLNLDNVCTLLFLGTLDKNKKPNKLIEIMNYIDIEVNVIFLGDGPLYNELKNLNNKNVFMPGYVKSNIELYLSASDIVIVPGRGGMNISESLAFGLPVIVHQADGIEYDLIKNGKNGFIIPDDEISTYCFSIKEIMSENFEFINEVNYNANTMANTMANGCKKILKI